MVVIDRCRFAKRIVRDKRRESRRGLGMGELCCTNIDNNDKNSLWLVVLIHPMISGCVSR